MKMIELYPHNQRTVANVYSMWETTNRVAVVQATGTGKSYIILKCLFDNYHQNKIVIAPSNYILDHIQSEASKDIPNTIMLTYAELTLLSQNEMEVLNPKIIVLDEFHRCGAEVWGSGVKRLLDAFPYSRILGTSSTPIRHLDNVIL